VKGHTSVRSPASEVRVDNDHRGSRCLSAERRARRGVQSGENSAPRSVLRPPTKLGPHSGPGAELHG
jgi:hypothetical protein